MAYKARAFSITIKKESGRWHRAYCGGCTYKSNQHADPRGAERAAKLHAEKKHFNDKVTVVWA